MFAVQVEGELRVVHFRQVPAIRHVACAAVRSELSVVVIVFGMAGSTILRGTFEDAVDMTACARHAGVFAVQMEGKFRVIYICRFPGIGSVAGPAAGSILASMKIILLMTGVAILRGRLQVREVAVI